ncbi:MAG: MMPL family transporter [Proteobacteria bacterium]|nr:MMPL family transporter [Pseudomonadota bacterium]
MIQRLRTAYRGLFLQRPWLALAALALLLGFFAYHAQDFRLDASSDSLVLEDDEALQVFREVSARYQTQDLLVVTYTPEAELFSDASLEPLGRLRDELRRVEGIASVLTILDVPLLQSSDVPLLQMAENVQTLEHPTVDRERARRELIESPVFRDLVISRDQGTTALLLNLQGDPELSALLAERNRLLVLRRSGDLDEAQSARLAEATEDYERARIALADRRHREIAEIRGIVAGYGEYGTLHLGGVPMIADDMVSYVRSDLIAFGLGVLVFIVVVLSAIFRQPRWVILPLLSCGYAGLTMVGTLGLIGWDVTVISSNFLSLMLIVTISMNIHLAVRYRQLLREAPDEPHASLVWTTLRRMVWPCLYTALTTIIGFSSLVFSGIKPVIDFGWMMSIGLAVVFLTSFSLFPTLLILLDKPAVQRRSELGFPLMRGLARLAEKRGGAVIGVAAVLALVSLWGVSRLEVENSFIDYFGRNTEIYRGMKLVDEKLGGTTPMDVLVSFEPAPEAEPAGTEAGEDDFFDDEYEEDLDDWDLDAEAGPENWFTAYKIDRVKQVHDYLDRQPEIGKVLSLASVVRVAEALNDGRELDGVELAVLYKRLPGELRSAMVDPYFSYEQNEARLMLRIFDSRPGVRRKQLLERIEADLERELGLSAPNLTLTGTLVLYNNMLQSLYSSQIASLGAVTAGIALMFLVLFRSPLLVVIGIVPNLLAAGTVLGLMGLAGIPLDMMTITIAAITIGIAVDNAIHYIYRFREEYARRGDYVETLRACHASIGRAVLYTSATIIFGFSILALSNFWPTIYFGALTALAMGMALTAALTLLPKLLLLWRPF